MKTRKILIAAVGMVAIAGLAWVVSSDQTTALKSNEIAVAERQETDKDQAVMGRITHTQPTTVELSTVEPSSSWPAPNAATPIAVAPAPRQTPMGSVHVARAGETVSGIAADIPGNQGRAYQAAIIDANPSLKADPDRLVAGRSYVIPASSEVIAVDPANASATTAEPGPTTRATPEIKPLAAKKQPATELRYTARAGDTLIAMAEAFLGSGSKVNQDAIVAANVSLDADPNQVVAGRTYRIPAPDGLSASATSSSDNAAVRPTVQPDADELVAGSSQRSLRYTARSGDTVTTLAIKLLGSDTVEARDAIINHNPALKADPDRVIAGQTYSIPAPAAQ